MDLHVIVGDRNRTVGVDGTAAHRSIADVLRSAEMSLNTRCGQRGICDGCLVDLVSGTLREVESGTRVEADQAPVRLRGCAHRLDGDGVTIRIPARSLLAQRPAVVDQFKLNVSWAHDPLAGSDERTIGAAIDVGTTTVALLLVDLSTGRIVGKASSFNAQSKLGDNVLTRINLCTTDPSSVAVLQRAIVDDTLGPLLEQAMGRAAVTGDHLRAVTVAGNTTMLHLLAGVDPAPMGLAPFTPDFLEHRVLTDEEIDLPRPRGDGTAAGEKGGVPVHLLPGAAAYIGADVCAGVLATGLAYDEGPCLLVDVGTNGEIVARCGDRLLGCATAAGPAFEGAGLACGIRAGDGAISRVRFETDPFGVAVETIGGGAPEGLCGTAYIDVLAEGRRIGLLGPTGRFEEALPKDAEWVDHGEYGRGLLLARGEEDRTQFVTEPDIAALLQAKAAIAAGIGTLLDRLGLAATDVRTLYLAGGFGMYMNVEAAIDCGLLPGFVPGQVQLVGNTSLAGAFVSLLDASVLDELERIGKTMEIVELNLDPHFESRYIDMLALP
ncbi:MAG: hypothetical protein CMJ18_07920 [Phycisphaeraceae bacterium]|nr:hypothetical protein [Phycisphaeraceae bacterium]